MGLKLSQMLLEGASITCENVEDISYAFVRCHELISLPDISKWNINKVKDISYIFCGCSSLKSISFILNWHFNNEINFQGIIEECNSLGISKYIPDISEWDIFSFKYFRSILKFCEQLNARNG